MFDEPGFLRVPGPDERPSVLYTFVYCSRAATGVDEAEVKRIVEAAQRRNFVQGITGVLVFGSGVFFQWIEGPALQMQSLITNLRSDPRHYDVVALDWSEEQRERLYPNWEMEQVEADDIREVLQDAFESAEDEHNVEALKRTLVQLDAGPLGSLWRS